jgi:response regulator RpfG family c-di-GMP phosphodiesterase
VLDGQMAGIDGIDLCRRVRARVGAAYQYVLMLTVRTEDSDPAVALQAGADDVLLKPYRVDELRSRVRVAERVTLLESALADRARDLEAERGRWERLEGLLAICMHCKRIRDDRSGGAVWEPLDQYIGRHTQVRFTHSLCQECLDRFYPGQASAPTDEGGGTG